MIKWPSFRDLFTQAGNTSSRYPFAMLAATMGTVILLVIIEQQTDVWSYLSDNGQSLMASLLGVLIFFIADIYAERHHIPPSRKLVIEIIAFIIIITYYLLLPKELAHKNYIRFILFFMTGLLLVSYIPFTKTYEVNAFWHFNLLLTVRIMLSGLYSAMLFGGISLALFAMGYLFGLTISAKLYLQLFIAIFGIFNTLIFLAGIPDEIQALEKEETYPRVLRFCVQFVLLPLIVIYLSILYVYGASILVSWTLPKGLVTYLVLVFSVIGMATFLIIYPIRQQKEGRTLQAYSRNFSLSLFPLLALLFWGLGKRIQDYGLTELRYFALVLAVWLAGINLYLLISKAKNIKVITISLSFVCLLSAFGPWGVFMTADRSQASRFKKIMLKSQLLKEGKITPNAQAKPLSLSDHKNLHSILQFFAQRKRLARLQPFIRPHLDSLLSPSDSEHRKIIKLYALMGENVTGDYVTDLISVNTKQFNFQSRFDEPVRNIKGYNYIIKFKQKANSFKVNKQRVYLLGDKEIELYVDWKKNRILLHEKKDTLVNFLLDPMLEKLVRKFSNVSKPLPHNEMVLIEAGKSYKAKLQITQVNIARRQDSENKMRSMSGELLLYFSKPEGF
ncbi:DUF4153 domain-containing protein [uncultured Microscilla sp.]|uniref:DUF4153 domain-containing protein n=1 Tax=uncultured Microscilla sp. TaxID=432653 RepID=UPI0026088865|nr:DUF4153 domain-containing protein [uncultured Microscilla sp.]